MTLTVKLLLIATLILSIIIPFGYYLLGEQSKKRYKKAIGANVFFFFGAFVDCGNYVIWRRHCTCSRSCNADRF